MLLRPLKHFALWFLAALPSPIRGAVVGFYQSHCVFIVDALSRNLGAGSYRRWIKRFDTLSAEDRSAVLADIGTFANGPLISVVVPVFNTPERYLRAALDSVLAQLYPNWELCIADDASTSAPVPLVLAEYAARDQRVRIVSRNVNGGIAAASNSAIDIAAGDFIAFLDHDDLLAAHALYMVAKEIVAHPNVDLVYSDEDKLDQKNRRFDPYFKCDWNPDLFLSQNMICHLGVYRSSLVRRVGSLRSAFDGSQDYDLALRLIEHTRPERIRHVPRVLYHWRAAANSTALSPRQKPYAAAAARNAVEDHLRRRGIRAEVRMARGLMFQEVHYAIDTEPLLTIIIPTKDRSDLLSRCVHGVLAETNYRNLQVLIVDNLSEEAATHTYLARIAADPRVRVIRYQKQFNFSLINNWAAEQASGEILLFLNNDIEVIEASWLRHMVANARRPEVGAVGAKLLYPNGRIQHGGIILGMGGVAGHFHLRRRRDDPGYFGRAQLQQNLSAVTGACLAVRHAVFDEVGGFDGKNLRVAFNDVDLCLRIRERGYLIVWTPLAELYHHESASRGSDLLPERHQEFLQEGAYMRAQWGKVLDRDPYFSPNLALSNPIRLGCPPPYCRASSAVLRRD